MEVRLREVAPERELAGLLAKYEAIGGVLDYIFLEPEVDGPTEEIHRAAALAGMAAIACRWGRWAIRRASEENPTEAFSRVRWDEAKLTGEPVAFSTFWGTDDVEPKPLGDRAWSIPEVDGYKTAFFHPPHGLGGAAEEKAELFADINRHVLGIIPERAEIVSWSTDWSNYFDAGNEWWGALFWTIRPAGSRRLAVIGASTTD